MSRVFLNKLTIRGGNPNELKVVEDMFKTQEGTMEFALSKIVPIPDEFSEAMLVHDLELVEVFRRSGVKHGIRKLEANLKSGKAYKELVKLSDELAHKGYARCFSEWKNIWWGCPFEVNQLYMGYNDDKSELVVIFESLDTPPLAGIRKMVCDCSLWCDYMLEFFSDDLNENGWQWYNAWDGSGSGGWSYYEGQAFRDKLKQT